MAKPNFTRWLETLEYSEADSRRDFASAIKLDFDWPKNSISIANIAKHMQANGYDEAQIAFCTDLHAEWSAKDESVVKDEIEAARTAKMQRLLDHTNDAFREMAKQYFVAGCEFVLSKYDVKTAPSDVEVEVALDAYLKKVSADKFAEQQLEMWKVFRTIS
jgi:hypothetical protein